MTNSEVATADGYKATIDKVNAIQAKITGDTGATGVAVVAGTDLQILVTAQELRAALGDSAYNTIAATALTSLNTALTTAKSTATTALTAFKS